MPRPDRESDDGGQYVADFADFDQLLWRGVLLTMALILPTSACLGAAFSVCAGARRRSIASRARPLRPGLRDQHARIGDGLAGRGFLFIPGLRHSADAVDRERIADRLHGASDLLGALTGMSRVVD
jgi:hypothetical protein